MFSKIPFMKSFFFRGFVGLHRIFPNDSKRASCALLRLWHHDLEDGVDNGAVLRMAAEGAWTFGEKSLITCYLVGGWWMMTFPIYGNIKNVPNHPTSYHIL